MGHPLRAHIQTHIRLLQTLQGPIWNLLQCPQQASTDQHNGDLVDSLDRPWPNRQPAGHVQILQPRNWQDDKATKDDGIVPHAQLNHSKQGGTGRQGQCHPKGVQFFGQEWSPV